MRHGMRFTLSVALIFVCVLVTPRDASSGKVHALTKIFYKNIQRDFCEKRLGDNACGMANRCEREWTKSANGQDKGLKAGAHAIQEWEVNCTSMYHSQGGRLPNGRFGHWTHAHHHGASLVQSGESSPSEGSDQVPPVPPFPGDSANTHRLDVTSTNSPNDSFDIHIDSMSFLQVYLDNVDPGDSVFMDWTFNVNGAVSWVHLAGYVTVGGVDSIVVSTDGRFSELPYTLTPYPNGAHALSFGELHFMAAGTVEEADFEIVSRGGGAVPSDTCIDPPSEMIAWYTGDLTTPEDHLGQHDGVYVGLPISAIDWKVGGGALEMHSPDTYVEVPDHDDLDVGTGDFSIDMWVKTTANSGVQALIDKRVSNGPAGALGYMLFVFNGNLSLQLCNPSLAHFNYISTLPVADGNWHFVAVTVDRDSPTGLVLYVDDSSHTFNPMNRQGNLANTAKLLIGAQHSSLGGGVFNGLVDEIEIFMRALESSEVASIWQAGSLGKCGCQCDCPGDPSMCDDRQDITDVVQTINVAFRGANPIPDPNVTCPNDRTDVNCSGTTDVVDVVNMVNVTFRGANADAEFCTPCQ